MAPINTWERISQAQAGRGFLWSPVALTFGIWAYFGMGVEPNWALVAVCAALALIGMWVGRARPLLFLVALCLAGFVLAKLRAEWVATPVLQATTAELAVTGIVEDASHASAKRMVVILAVDQIEGMMAAAAPRRLRLTGSVKQGVPAIGARIALKARLSPLPSPVLPGGFDYGRQLWFDGIGGTGRIMGTISVLSSDTPWRLRPRGSVEWVRRMIGEGIRKHLDGVNASFAEALITGERSTIPKDVNQSLQASGLFHILSISGLHMWLVAGGIFWTVRAILALIPHLALRYPIKKWAAAAALAAGYFYMLLADSGVATQRSYIMIAVVFFAIIVDRPAISLRNLALAAIVILVLEPEAATQASFQMSFLAVMGLAAYYEFWEERRRLRERGHRQRPGLVRRLMGAAAGAVAVSILTTLIAGTLSTIPAAYHFGRLAPYGVVANGLALPVISFVVMPTALLGTLAMPFGLDAMPLWVMGKGLELVVVISNWVASFPGAYLVVRQQSAGAVVMMASGAALLCLLSGRARLLGIVVMILGLGVSQGQRMPDILIDRTASNVAFRNEAGELIPALARKSRFAIEKWLLANGEGVSPATAAKRPGWTCGGNRCMAALGGKTIAYVQEKEGATLDCRGIDILIADYPLRKACPSVPLRIDRFDVWRSGAHAIHVGDGGFKIQTARQLAGSRPWVVVPQARKDKFQQRVWTVVPPGAISPPWTSQRPISP